MEWLYAKGIPIEAQYLYRKAHEMAGLGRDTTALNYYRQALIIAPAYVKVLYEMGDCYAHLGRFAEARSVYERATSLNPESGETRQKREQFLPETGRDGRQAREG